MIGIVCASKSSKNLFEMWWQINGAFMGQKKNIWLCGNLHSERCNDRRQFGVGLLSPVPFLVSTVLVRRLHEDLMLEVQDSARVASKLRCLKCRCLYMKYVPLFYSMAILSRGAVGSGERLHSQWSRHLHLIIWRVLIMNGSETLARPAGLPETVLFLFFLIKLDINLSYLDISEDLKNICELLLPSQFCNLQYSVGLLLTYYNVLSYSVVVLSSCWKESFIACFIDLSCTLGKCRVHLQAVHFWLCTCGKLERRTKMKQISDVLCPLMSDIFLWI